MSDARTKRLNESQKPITDGGIADDFHKLIIPKNTTANLAEITPQEASIAYDTDLQQVVVSDGSAFVPSGTSLPDQSSHAGEFLQTDGSSLSWSPAGGGAGTWASTLWSSLDSFPSYLSGAAPAIVGSNTGNNIIAVDDSTTAHPGNLQISGGSYTGAGAVTGGEIFMYGGSSTGTNPAGGIYITAGENDGSGNGGELDLIAGPADTGTGGIVYIAAGDGAIPGKIVLDDLSGTITSGQIWTSTDTSGSGHWAVPTSSFDILVFTSNPGPAGIAGAPIFDVAFTVTGLRATDTILSVTQKNPGAAGTLALLGWHSQANNALTGEYVADPGVGAIITVAVKR